MKSVAFVSVSVGRTWLSSTSASANHGSMNTSPPVIPTHPKPSSLASSTARANASRDSVRRSAMRGEDSVRQYAQARLQW